MSKAKPYDDDSLERALIVHGVTYRRPDPPQLGLDGRRRRGKWYIDVHNGRDMTDREVYAFLAGFKLAKDRAEKAARVREEVVHTTSDRGFAHPEPVKGTDNGVVRVYESSGAHAFWPEKGTDGKITQGEAAGPFLWLRVCQQFDLDKPETEAAAHLTIDAARIVRDQLTWLIDRSEA